MDHDNDASTPKSPAAAPDPWHPMARISLRFLFIYLLLYILSPMPFWEPIIPGVGSLLGVEVLYKPNGSGDTTYNYVQLALTLALAGIGTLIWSVLDRKREAYPRLASWTLVFARYFLASAMVGYGLAKVFMMQFSEPGLMTLMQRYGNASPMGLAWVFTGFSSGYQFVAGFLELTAGLLLLSRRTATAGALLTMAVMSNVVMMNYAFDIPVKLLSSHLLLTALVIASLDARRLINVLILHRTVEPVEFPPHFEARKWHIAGRVVKGIVLFLMIVPGAIFNFQGYDTYGPGAARSPYFGVYEIVELREDGELRPGDISDKERWRFLIFDNPGLVSIQKMDDSFKHYGVELDEETETLTVHVPDPDAPRFAMYMYGAPEPKDPTTHEWTLSQEGEGVLVVSGEFEGKALELRAEMIDMEFLLTSRGFNWVNETPLNR